MHDVTIREAVSRDVTRIVALWTMLQEVNAAFDPRLTPNAAAAEWFNDFIREQMDARKTIVLVAEVGDELVGYVFAQIMTRPTLIFGDLGYLADLYVRSDWQGKGLGRALYQRIKEWFIKNNVHSIEVQVVRANPGSQAFWRKMGFQDFLRTLRTEL